MKLKAPKKDYMWKISHCKKCDTKLKLGNNFCDPCRKKRKRNFCIGSVLFVVFVVSLYVVCMIG